MTATTPTHGTAASSSHQQHARRRSSAARTSASTPDLSRTLSRDDAAAPNDEASAANDAQEPPSSALHPRVAVLLGINESFHVPLLLCRGLATAPAIWWFGKCWALLWRLLISYAKGGEERDVEWGAGGWRGGGVGENAGFGDGASGKGGGQAASLVVMEVALAALWVSYDFYLHGGETSGYGRVLKWGGKDGRKDERLIRERLVL